MTPAQLQLHAAIQELEAAGFCYLAEVLRRALTRGVA